MLTVAILKILGLTALGALVGFIVVPLMLYLTRVVAYVLAVIVVLLRAKFTSQLSPKEVFKTFPKLLKESHKYVNNPIYESDATKGSICHPNGIDNGHHASVSHVITSQKPTDSKRYERSQNSFDVVKQPFIPDIPKKFRHIFHTTISFYKSYYGHSTKVEKNLLITKRRDGFGQELVSSVGFNWGSPNSWYAIGLSVLAQTGD